MHARTKAGIGKASHWTGIRPQLATTAIHGNAFELRGLAGNLLATQEEENRRVSRELHDELGQRLALLEIQIEEMKRRLGPDSQATPELEGLKAHVGEIADDVHRICCRLHPAVLENLGLLVALRSYCEEFTVWSGVKTRFSCCGIAAKLPSTVSLCLYRVVQEGLRNVSKHAGAHRAMVALRGNDEGIQLVIKDTGHGFDLNQARLKGGLGLISLSERIRLTGGSCSIHSVLNHGTRIQAWVPLALRACATVGPMPREGDAA